MPDTIGRPKQSSPWLRYKLGLDPFGGQEPEPTIEPVPEINWADYLLDPTAKIRSIFYRPPSQDYSSLLDRFTFKGKNSIADIYGK